MTDPIQDPEKDPVVTQPGLPAVDPPVDEPPRVEPEKTYTKAEIDHILRERLKAERDKYADYGDLKEQAQKYQELQDAQKSDLQKAQTRAEAAEAKLKEVIQTANQRLLRAALIAEAGKLGAAHPEDAFRLADLTVVIIDDDGAITGAAEAVKVLVDNGRLPLTGRKTAPSLNGGAGAGERQAEREPELSAEEIKVANALGLKPAEYKKHKKPTAA